MSNLQKTLWGIIILIILIGGYWWWSSQSKTITSQTNPFTQATSTTETPASNPSTGANAIPMAVTVTFDGSSFFPQSITIAQGGTVTWVSTAGDMWVASDPDPIHNGYDGTTLQQHCATGYSGPAPFDECTGSSSNWNFTFNRVGTWGYNDDLDPAVMGSVTVVAQ